MTSYMINFGVYTMAMVGIIVVALFVYKKSTLVGTAKKSSLKIDDKIALNARKSLYVVNAGGERFLIAGDMDNTSLIAKLSQDEQVKASSGGDILKFSDELNKQSNRKLFVSREKQFERLPERKQDSLDAQKSLDDAFNKAASVKFEKYLDIKAIRKKPVMKELAKKLAEI